MSAKLINVDWTCTPDAGATCTAAGLGNINDPVTLPAGKKVTFSVHGQVPGDATGLLTNVASITANVSGTDANPTNNSATDADTILPPGALLIDGFESADFSGWSEAYSQRALVPSSLVLNGGEDREFRLPAARAVRLSLDLDLTGLKLAEGSVTGLLSGWHGQQGAALFRLELKREGGQWWIGGELRQSDGTAVRLPWAPLAGDRHSLTLELHWWSAPRAGSHAGGFRLWLDGNVAADLTGVANDGATVDRLRFEAGAASKGVLRMPHVLVRPATE